MRRRVGVCCWASLFGYPDSEEWTTLPVVRPRRLHPCLKHALEYLNVEKAGERRLQAVQQVLSPSAAVGPALVPTFWPF